MTNKQSKTSSLRTIEDYEAAAIKALPKAITEYVQKSAGKGKSNEWNKSAFERYAIIPSVLRGIEVLITNQVIGDKDPGNMISAPLIIAPAAWQELYTTEKESATLKAVEEFNTRAVISSFSTLGFDELKKVGDIRNTWYQLLPNYDSFISKKYIDMAIDAGVSGLVISADAPSGCNMCSIKKSQVANIVKFPEVNSQRLPLLPMPEGSSYKSLDAYYEENVQPGDSSWENIEKLVKYSRVPVFIKGIMNPADALKAKDIGASGIIISNHGGRQMDRSIPTLYALDNITSSGNNYGKIEIYMDGGIRSGSDIFIAMALGAKAVMIGRPSIYGLAVGGKNGLIDVLNILRNELAHTMLQAGCKNLSEITREKLYKMQ